MCPPRAVRSPAGRLLSLVLAAFAGLALPAAAGDQVGAVLYRLDAASAYEEGCFEPCLCPIMMNDTLKGTFLLIPSDHDGGTGSYSLLDVAWTYQRGDIVIPAAGSGTYTRDADRQRLELDLMAGDGPVRHYDSGLVAAPRDFPQIEVAASVNGFFCYDHVFVVSALPASVAGVAATWGALKAAYR